MNEFQEQTTRPFNFKEACKYLSLSASTLYKKTHRKEITFYRPAGKLIYFLQSDLNSWLLKNKISSNQNIDEKAIDHITKNGAVL